MPTRMRERSHPLQCGDGGLAFDRDGTGTDAAVTFAHLSPGLSLGHLDFLVV